MKQLSIIAAMLLGSIVVQAQTTYIFDIRKVQKWDEETSTWGEFEDHGGIMEIQEDPEVYTLNPGTDNANSYRIVKSEFYLEDALDDGTKYKTWKMTALSEDVYYKLYYTDFIEDDGEYLSQLTIWYSPTIGNKFSIKYLMDK